MDSWRRGRIIPSLSGFERSRTWADHQIGPLFGSFIIKMAFGALGAFRFFGNGVVKCMDVDDEMQSEDVPRMPVTSNVTVATKLDNIFPSFVSPTTRQLISTFAETVQDLAVFTEKEFEADVKGKVSGEEEGWFLELWKKAIQLHAGKRARTKLTTLSNVLPVACPAVSASTSGSSTTPALRNGPRGAMASGGDETKRLAAAADLLAVFLRSTDAGRALRNARAADGDHSKWAQEFSAALAHKCEHGSLRAHLRTLRRIAEWEQAQTGSQGIHSSPLLLRLFLLDASAR